jgi:hypothetical protein
MVNYFLGYCSVSLQINLDYVWPDFMLFITSFLTACICRKVLIYIMYILFNIKLENLVNIYKVIFKIKSMSVTSMHLASGSDCMYCLQDGRTAQLEHSRPGS